MGEETAFSKMKWPEISEPVPVSSPILPIPATPVPKAAVSPKPTILAGSERQGGIFGLKK
jgi:hypothetical protein